MIYLDYAANTPVDEEVLSEYLESSRKYIANPNSIHKLGKKAKDKIDLSSSIIAKYFNTTKEGIIYTSGSSESNNLVIKGLASLNSKRKKIIISEIEHSSIIAPCNYLASLGYDIVMVPLTKDGTVDLKCLKDEIDNNTILVSICTVDSELGTIQPINKIANIVKKYKGCYFHTDATQAIGKVNVDYSNVDFITFAPHKFYGINGIGVLVNVNEVKINPQIHGGKSTTIFRSGTPVTASICATETAFSLATKNLIARNKQITKLNNYLREELIKIPNIHINSPANTLPNILNISVTNVDIKKLLDYFDKNEIYLSTKTACSLNNFPSRSVLAITKDENLAKSCLRISLSHLTTKDEINTFIDLLNKFIKKNNNK